MEQKIINKLESLGINVEEYDIIDVSENYKFLQGSVCFLTKKFKNKIQQRAVHGSYKLST